MKEKNNYKYYKNVLLHLMYHLHSISVEIYTLCKPKKITF